MPGRLQISKAAAVVLVCGLGAGVAHARVELQPCRNSITPEQQIAMGRQALNQVSKKLPLLPEESPVSRYVSGLGQKLAGQAPGYRWPYSFHVANVADVNAFALPGGSIFVTAGTVQAAMDEAQLAGVLAHEIAHVMLQHPVCNLGAPEAPGTPAGLNFLRMSRGAEQQADMASVGILYDAGYDPRGMSQFFEGVQAKFRNGGAGLLADHPNPGNRSLFVSNEVETFAPKTDYTANSMEFAQAQQAAGAMRPFSASEVESGAWKQQGASQAPGAAQAENALPPAQASTPEAAAPQAAAVPVDATQPGSGAATAANAGQWTTYNGQGFSMDLPADWQVGGNGKAAMMAPEGGVKPASDGTQNLLYGVLTDVFQPQQQGGSAQDVFTALLKEVKQQNPGLEATEGVQEVPLGGASAQMVHGVNKKANNGAGEHAWIVGVPQNGAMRYFVFVSPGKDVLSSRKTFQRMIKSIKVE